MKGRNYAGGRRGHHPRYPRAPAVQDPTQDLRVDDPASVENTGLNPSATVEEEAEDDDDSFTLPFPPLLEPAQYEEYHDVAVGPDESSD